jgi:spore maturation protein CgeB
LTTDSLAVEKYHALGCKNVVKTQWGVNHHLYKRLEVLQDFDVTFIGQVHSQRKKVVDRIRKTGINLTCWGKGWESGRLSQEEMIRTFSRSKINLNFTESSIVFGWKPIAKTFLTRRADDSMRLNTPGEIRSNLSVLFNERRPQIKGRNFEIPGSGGFLLTSHADNLEEYFVPGKEIATFNGVDDLIGKIRYYLSHDTEREEIRIAGYKRAVREHTYEQRFRTILKAIGYEKV